MGGLVNENTSPGSSDNSPASNVSLGSNARRKRLTVRYDNHQANNELGLPQRFNSSPSQNIAYGFDRP